MIELNGYQLMVLNRLKEINRLINTCKKEQYKDNPFYDFQIKRLSTEKMELKTLLKVGDQLE